MEIMDFENFADSLKSLSNNQQVNSNKEFKDWCDLLDAYSQIYYDNCKFKIMPLVLLALYARGELKIEKDIELDKNNVHSPFGLVVAYREYDDIMNGFTYSTFQIYNEEVDDHFFGGKNRVLLCTTPNKDEEGNEHIIYYIIEKILEENIKSYAGNSHATISAFEFYDFLCQQPIDVVNENVQYLFEMVMKRITEPMYKEFYGTSPSVCNEFYQFVGGLLDKKCSNNIYHLAAGPGNIIKNTNECDAIATTYSKSEYLYIYFLYTLILKRPYIEMDLMTDDYKWSEFKCFNSHFGFPEYIEPSFILFDNVNFEKNFLKELLIEFTYRPHNSELKGCFLIHQCDLEYLKKELYSVYERCVSKVVFMPDQLVALVLDAQKEKNSNITLVDATDEEKFIAKNVLRKIRTGKKCYELTVEEFADTDFQFDINCILRKRICLPPKQGMKIVQLKEFLSRPRYDIYNFQTVLQKIDYYSLNYSSFLPYYCLYGKTLINISKNEAVNCIHKSLLVNINDIKKYQPKIFVINDDLSQGFEFGEVWQYEIKNDYIDEGYLISEMTKEYFVEQVFPCANINAVAKWDTILDCYIYMPDERETLTPVERQKLLLNAGKMEFINELLQSYDYDIEKIVSAEKNALPYGTKLCGGRYMILQEIGFGGFGKTYKAKYIGVDCKEFARTVAIKEFFDNQFQKRAFGTTEVINSSSQIKNINKVRNKFFREAEKIREFSDCDNIIKVHEVFDENNTSYYSMEYIDGKNLRDYVPDNAALDETEAVNIIRQVANALKRMHSAKMLHLDVKHSNIMIAKDGRVVLVDFGTAHRNLEKISDCTSVPNIRSRGFSPCEDIESADETYDIYSLGRTLLFMLGGVTKDGDDSEMKTPVTKELWQCIEKATQKDRKCRPQSIDEFLKMLPS